MNSIVNMEEFYDAVDWPWEERSMKINSNLRGRQNLDCELNRVASEKYSVQWERQ